jgi:hypothetical protein
VILAPGRNIYFSTYPRPTLIHLSHCFTSASKPAAHESFDCCLGYFRTWSGIICDFQTSLREFVEPVVNCFMRQTLPTANRKHMCMNILCTESICPQKKCSRALLFGCTSSRTVAILTTETSL